MALDPQDTEGLEEETVTAWSVAEDVMIGVMAAAAMRAARKPNVRVAAQQEWARTVNPRVTATASGLVADTPAMVERATEQAAIRGAEAAAQEAATVRPAAPRHRATLPGSGTRTSTGGGTTAAPSGTSPSRRTTRPMTLPRTQPQVPGGTTPPPVRPRKAAAEATGRALDKAARQVPRNAKSAWDRIINDAVNKTVAGELTIEQAMQQAMDQAAKEGIGFYRDNAGRKWGLDTYSEMAIRTGTNQALRDAHAAELLAQGIDLVIVSSHANPAPQCAPYEQKVLSLTGEHPNGRQTIDGQSVTVTASVAEAVANGLEHPNCRHVYTAYLPGFTEPLPVADDPDHEGYKATQQQRYYEREIRRSQRMEAAATTPEARAKAAARHRAYEAKLAAHRRQWDLPRRRHREKLRQPGNPMPQV
ncbi:phage minor capsid protein [Corynebacterium sp. AOP40-4SA-5]|uniref:phage minor capsid protein n=1 Tax=Corynebacterium sp. AOP40-4SA-5 TaxID=3457678 RepID=UPI0040333DDF